MTQGTKQRWVRPWCSHIPIRDIAHWASRYRRQSKDHEWELELRIARHGKAARRRGHWLKSELVEAAQWKSHWIVHHIQKNTDLTIERLTRNAIGEVDERARLEHLDGLKGVAWPMASVILHFTFPESYPILDYRALGALGQPLRVDNFRTWMTYTSWCRSAAAATKLSMRVVDRALWQYHKEKEQEIDEAWPMHQLPSPWNLPWCADDRSLPLHPEPDLLWLRPDPVPRGHDQASGYALTIDGYELMRRNWGVLNPVGGGGSARYQQYRREHNGWDGAFADLRICLHFCQRGIKWTEGSTRAVKSRRDFHLIHTALAPAWETEVGQHEVEAVTAQKFAEYLIDHRL